MTSTEEQLKECIRICSDSIAMVYIWISELNDEINSKRNPHGEASKKLQLLRQRYQETIEYQNSKLNDYKILANWLEECKKIK